MRFATALIYLTDKRNDDVRVCRRGWNGKGMWVSAQFPDEHSKMTQPYLYMKTAQGDLIPWLISQADAFANDWEFVD
jgi:hypothetical protein